MRCLQTRGGANLSFSDSTVLWAAPNSAGRGFSLAGQANGTNGVKSHGNSAADGVDGETDEVDGVSGAEGSVATGDEEEEEPL